MHITIHFLKDILYILKMVHWIIIFILKSFKSHGLCPFVFLFHYLLHPITMFIHTTLSLLYNKVKSSSISHHLIILPHYLCHVHHNQIKLKNKTNLFIAAL